MTVDWGKVRENKDDFKKAVSCFTHNAFPNISCNISNCLVFEKSGSIPVVRIDVIWEGKTLFWWLFFSDDVADRNSWAEALGRYANGLMMAILQKVGGLFQ